MPIIPKVGRKSPKIRLLVALMYTVLAAGAVTMVYPFLLMISTSLTSSVDTNEYRLLPRFFTDEAALFAKYADDRYAGNTDEVNRLYGTDFKKPQDAVPPQADLDNVKTRAFIREWQECAQNLPERWKQGAFREFSNNPGLLKERYQEFLREKFRDDIAALNRAYTDQNENFRTVTPPLERLANRTWQPDDSPKMRDYLQWRATLPPELIQVFSVEAMWAQWLREERYKNDLKAISEAWGRPVTTWNLVLPPARQLKEPIWAEWGGKRDAKRETFAWQEDWEEFARTRLPVRYAFAASSEDYQRYLRSLYPDIAALNRRYGTRYARFEEIPLPDPLNLPDRGDLLNDYARYIEKSADINTVGIDSPERRFRDQIRLKYGNIAAINAALGTDWKSEADIQPPYHLADALHVHDHKTEMRREYAARNYRQVLGYVLLHGRSVAVTVIFCLAMIATNLIVNPLCAYALSRYNLPYASKVLLFLLATMAFPAEVAMIPNFLLLKQFGMLNTYWALILPGMASGYSIFLLKGFFDSLPRELYEAATLDGASEMRMFWKLTLPLCKPIFAVIALGAFTAAYGAFMFAFIVCQDSKMWTLMVWLYQLQIRSPQYVVMAGLTIAAIPTLLVFLLCQNVILRGIILPSYK